ncbi:hypothetical protein [Streptomyces sp. SID11385]|uniref:hypothetical protein n=1 Tax=Streptomyces sp. SID11385 TaxID=2706031 RepID=UPI0013C9FCB3|nr:hypothetical protein [Streptomyces sp. SID11385]
MTNPLGTAPLAVGGVLVAVVLLVAGRLRRVRTGGRGTVAVKVAALAAACCTAYSADTSWRFAAHHLDMRDGAERTVMFGAAELALFAMALLARQNLHGPRRAAGLPGVLVWVITAVQTLPAYAESGPVGGTVRAFVGPVMAAVLWHSAMGIELRHRTPDAASRGLGAVLIRQGRERLLARLGIVEQDRGAAQIARDRAARRAVALAARLAEMPPGRRARRSGRRVIRRLSRALARAGIDADPTRDGQFLRQLATRRQAADLATIDLPARWAGTGGRAVATQVSTAGRAADGAREHPGGAPFQPVARPETAQPDDTARPETARPDDTARPDRPGGHGGTLAPATGTDPEPHHSPGRKSRASDDRLRRVARKIHASQGRLSRDLLEKAVREAGYSVASDHAGEIVRELKAELRRPTG